MTRSYKNVARRLEEEQARLEKVLAEIQRKFREGWWGEYSITFKAGNPSMVRRLETQSTDDMI